MVSLETRSHIEFFGYTRDLLPFYAEADLLIDIDADIENDVFISSKFFNYLMINRKILCITGKNSPVTSVISKYNFEQIFVTNHNSENIFNIIDSISSNHLTSFSRNELVVKILAKSIEI